MNSTTLIEIATFAFWAVIGFILGANAGEQISLRRVDEEIARVESRDMPIRFAWADWRWLQVTILCLGLSLAILGWHSIVARSLGGFVAIFVVRYWWALTRPPAKLARIRTELVKDAHLSIYILNTLKSIVVVLGILMLIAPLPYKYWVIGIGVVVAVIGSLIDALLIAPAQLRRIQRRNRDIDDLLK